MRKITRCAAFAAAVSATACLAGDPLVRGKTALAKQQYRDADRELRSVPTTHPGYQEAQMLLGALLAIGGQDQPGLVQMVRARGLAPEAFDTHQDWLTALANLTGKLSRTWHVKADRPPSSLATSEAIGLVVGNNGMLTAFDAHAGVKWEHELGVRGGIARPIAVLAGDRVIAVEQAKGRAKLIALTTTSGEIAWSQDLGNQHPAENPLVADGKIFVGAPGKNHHGELRAFKLSDGAPLWAATLDNVPGPSVAAVGQICSLVAETAVACIDASSGEPGWHYEGIAQSPWLQSLTAVGTRLYVTSGGTLYALDVGKPGLAWKQAVDRSGISAPLPSDDGSELVVATRDAVLAYDASGGKRWIAHHTTPSTQSIDGKPLVRIDGLVVGWTADRLFAIDAHHAFVFDAAVGGSISAAPIASGPHELAVGISGKENAVVGVAVTPWS